MTAKPFYGSIAILYRRQVKLNFCFMKVVEQKLDVSPKFLLTLCFLLQISGKLFQLSFRDRKIPFNVHGVAFYRKKVAAIF